MEESERQEEKECEGRERVSKLEKEAEGKEVGESWAG
jgi:hypothetical protein